MKLNATLIADCNDIIAEGICTVGTSSTSHNAFDMWDTHSTVDGDHHLL